MHGPLKQASSACLWGLFAHDAGGSLDWKQTAQAGSLAQASTLEQQRSSMQLPQASLKKSVHAGDPVLELCATDVTAPVELIVTLTPSPPTPPTPLTPLTPPIPAPPLPLLPPWPPSGAWALQPSPTDAAISATPKIHFLLMSFPSGRACFGAGRASV